ncbi:MAG TPA: PRC-barrel domain-containing protein [Steroidobacteraceae bacterium]|nr:PRC-barrel domain-containing protein [Steroidobacteraceae bacterium]
MFRSLSDLETCSIGATDGEIGRVKDCYFDDESWVLRYFVVETGVWLANRRVLISPIAVGKPDWSAKSLPVAITKKQVADSPGIDTDRPVSRQHEMSYLGYYGYPYYWGGAGLWGGGAFPGMLLSGVGYGGTDGAYRQDQARGARADAEADAERHSHDDHHLRSGKAVVGYRMHASDGDLGHVRELLIDEDSWAIRYMIADTSNWWMGHRVLISPQWIESVSWAQEQVVVNLTRAAVKSAPPYLVDRPVDRAQEMAVFGHHRRKGYWNDHVSSQRRSTPRI